MEEVTKCRYIDCVDTREKEQILHELPVCDTRLCVRWLINSGHVDLIGRDLDALRSMKFFVCNNHFTEDCYLSKGTLKENAVPFPHWSAVSRTLKNLKTRRKVQVNGQDSSMEEVSINRPAEKNAPSEFDVEQWCRTCATKKPNLVSMTSKGKGTDMSLLSKLKLLIEIDDEDALPTNMCDECVDKLEQSFKFFQQIYVADNTLRHVFPNSRTNSVPKKPLYSLGEHMRKEQKEKEEKEKEQEKDKEEDQQERAPRITRGIFRRGRGRPRSRGLGGRGRGRQRSAQVAASVQSPTPAPISISGNNAIARTIYKTGTNESASLRNESRIEPREDERQGDTVFSLLTDTCRSDEELDWSDVLKVMSNQRYRTTEPVKPMKPETRIDEQTDRKIEMKVESSKPETTACKMETEWSTEDASMEEQNKVQVKVETGTEEKTKQKDQDKPKTTEEIEAARLRCEFCEQEFPIKRQLQKHLLTDHSELSNHICLDCLICYENESLLSKHRNSHHGDRTYRCEHCQDEFLEKRTLKEHVRKCPSTETSRYSCDSCEVTFDSKEQLAEHAKNHRDVSASVQSESEHSTKVKSETTSSPKRSVQSEEAKEVDGEPEKEEERSSTVATSSSIIVTHESNSNEKDGETATSSSRLEGNAAEQERADGKPDVYTECNEQMYSSYEDDEYEQHVLDHRKRLRISPR